MIFVRLILLVCLAFCVTTIGQGTRNLERDKSTATQSGKRIALIIGNGAYTGAPPLKNPPNDARDMAATLKALGFDVTSGINVNQRDFKRLIREFGQKLKAGGSGLFYYAGHGVQSKGRNYLIPVDAEIQSEADVEDTGVDLSLILNYMDDAANGLNIVILDACRNNPFARSFRSATGGLAQVDAPTGTLIAYATAPGTVASDGTDQNGLYTSELLKQMLVPGQSATDMFMRVRAEVMKKTASKQVPWEASSLVGSFYFSPELRPESGKGDTEKESKIDNSAFELSYWETVKNSTNPDDFKAYLRKFPNGTFADLASNRLKTLDKDGGAKLKTDDDPPLNRSFRVALFAGTTGLIARATHEGELTVTPSTVKFNSPGEPKYNFSLACADVADVSVSRYKTTFNLKAKDNSKKEFTSTKDVKEQEAMVLAQMVVQAVRDACTPASQVVPTSESKTVSVEGTTWTGDSENGKDHFKFLFAANGEVVRQWKRSFYPDSFQGTWIKVGNTITMEFSKSITCDRKMEMTVDGNKISGSYCDGKNKFTLEKAP